MAPASEPGADRERDALAGPRLEQAGRVAGEQDPAAAERAVRRAAPGQVAGVVEHPLPVQPLRAHEVLEVVLGHRRAGRARR